MNSSDTAESGNVRGDLHMASPDDVDDFSVRLGKLESRFEQSENSLLRKINAYAGLLALFVSIAAGSYSLYDVFLVQPKQDAAEGRKQLSAISYQLSAFRKDVQEAASSENPEDLYLAQLAINSARAPLLNDAREVLSMDLVAVDAATLLLFAEEFSNVDIDFAESLSSRSLTAASDDKPHELASVYAFHGAFLTQRYGVSRSAEIRDQFSKAYEFATDTEPLYRPDVMANVVGKWAITEAILGNCADAKSLYEEIVSPEVTPVQSLALGRLREETRNYVLRLGVCDEAFRSEVNP